MHTGKLRHRVKIQSNTQTIDSFGQVQYTWTDKAIVWAEIKNKIGGEGSVTDNAVAGKAIEVTVRFRADISKDDRIITLRDNRVFYIGDVQDEYGTRKMLRISCSETL